MAADENPALNPTRPWRTGEKHVAFEARALVRKLDANGRNLLHVLAEHATTGPVELKEMSAILEIDVPAIEIIVSRVNVLAGALGYVPLIRESHRGLYVEAEAAPVVVQGILDAQS